VQKQRGRRTAGRQVSGKQTQSSNQNVRSGGMAVEQWCAVSRQAVTRGRGRWQTAGRNSGILYSPSQSSEAGRQVTCRRTWRTGGRCVRRNGSR